MNDPLSIIGLVCAIGLIAAWVVTIINALNKCDDAPPGSMDDRGEREE